MGIEVDTTSLERFCFPITLIWELTNCCFSNCIYCSGAFPKKRGCCEMSYADRKKLVNELIDNKLFAVNLSGGEPFLSDDLLWITNSLTSAGIKVMIATSGLVHDSKVISKLIVNPNVAFNVSLDSFHNEVNDLHRGVLKSADRVKAFLGILALERTYIALECVLTKKNYLDIDEYLIETKKYPISEIRFQVAVPVSKEMRDSGLCLSEAEVRAVASKVEDLASYTSHTKIHFVNQSNMIQSGYRNPRNWGGIITPNGTLKVNAYLPFEFGNINDYGSLLAAWKRGFSHAWDYEPLHQQIASVSSIEDISRLCFERGYSTTKIVL